MKINLKLAVIIFISSLFVGLLGFFGCKYFFSKSMDAIGNKNVVSEGSYELPKTNLATSSDGKLVVFYKNIVVNNASKGELWMVNLENEKENLLAKDELSSSAEMAESSPDIPSVSQAVFSNDNKILYFIDEFAHVTSGNLYSINLIDKKMKLVCGSNYLDIFKSGKYKDYLITNQHRYYDGGGSYNDFYITDPNTGKDVKTIDSSLDKLGWENSLSNLSVPDKYSDLCGFMNNNCDGFNFVNGLSPKNLKNNYDTPDISLDIPGAVSGVMIDDDQKINIIAVPYFWSWASSGYGVYIIKNTNNKLEVIARVYFGKKSPDILSIDNNNISIYSFGDDENYNKICFFKNGHINGDGLSCEESGY